MKFLIYFFFFFPFYAFSMDSPGDSPSAKINSSRFTSLDQKFSFFQKISKLIIQARELEKKNKKDEALIYKQIASLLSLPIPDSGSTFPRPTPSLKWDLSSFPGVDSESLFKEHFCLHTYSSAIYQAYLFFAHFLPDPKIKRYFLSEAILLLESVGFLKWIQANYQHVQGEDYIVVFLGQFFELINQFHALSQTMATSFAHYALENSEVLTVYTAQAEGLEKQLRSFDSILKNFQEQRGFKDETKQNLDGLWFLKKELFYSYVKLYQIQCDFLTSSSSNIETLNQIQTKILNLKKEFKKNDKENQILDKWEKFKSVQTMVHAKEKSIWASQRRIGPKVRSAIQEKSNQVQDATKKAAFKTLMKKGISEASLSLNDTEFKLRLEYGNFVDKFEQFKFIGSSSSSLSQTQQILLALSSLERGAVAVLKQGSGSSAVSETLPSLDEIYQVLGKYFFESHFADLMVGTIPPFVSSEEQERSEIILRLDSFIRFMSEELGQRDRGQNKKLRLLPYYSAFLKRLNGDLDPWYQINREAFQELQEIREEKKKKKEVQKKEAIERIRQTVEKAQAEEKRIQDALCSEAQRNKKKKQQRNEKAMESFAVSSSTFPSQTSHLSQSEVEKQEKREKEMRHASNDFERYWKSLQEAAYALESEDEQREEAPSTFPSLSLESDEGFSDSSQSLKLTTKFRSWQWILEEMNSKTWKFTQLQLIDFYQALGATKRNGKGSHVALFFKGKLFQLFEETPEEFFQKFHLTLPKWDDQVPFYLRKQILVGTKTLLRYLDKE